MNSSFQKFIFITALTFIVSGCSTLNYFETKQTQVIETYPKNGAINVKPGIIEITVKFSREMSKGYGLHFPKESAGMPIYIEEPEIKGDTFKWVVRALPQKTYVIELQTDTENGTLQVFEDIKGNVIEPYILTFTTGEGECPR